MRWTPTLTGPLAVLLTSALLAHAGPKARAPDRQRQSDRATVTALCEDFAQTAWTLAVNRQRGMTEAEAQLLVEDYVQTQDFAPVIRSDYRILVPIVYRYKAGYTPAQHQDLARRACWEVWEPGLR